MELDKSEFNALQMLDYYIKSVTADLSDWIQSIILVGSLATGSYIPGPGDIDQITIIDDLSPDNAEELIAHHITQTMHYFDGAIHIAEIIYRRGDLERPWITEWNLCPNTKHLVTIPEELLRIHDHGQVKWGQEFCMHDLANPTIQEMINYEERWRIWNSEFYVKYPKLRLLNPVPIRLSVQSLLSSATMHYYFATGKTCFNKNTIADKIQVEIPDYRYLEGLKLATKVRLSRFTDVSSESESVLNECYLELAMWKQSHPGGSVPLIKSS